MLIGKCMFEFLENLFMFPHCIEIQLISISKLMHSASNNNYKNVHFFKGFINVYFVLIYQFTVLSKSLVSVIYLFWDIIYFNKDALNWSKM